MLAGVLVVAFPVSVFSDLWSEELKKVKGFDDLLIDDDEDENEDHEGDRRREKEAGQRVNDESHHNNTAPNVNSIRRRQYSDDAKTDAELEFLSSNAKYVVLEKKDLDEILSSLREIHEHQGQIKCILKKYYHVEN
jgi:hypothetical protein